MARGKVENLYSTISLVSDSGIQCSSFSAEGSICLHTLAATASLPTGDGEFEVTDLAADERFKSLPFVTGYPRMRYYYGLTFSTRRKIKIGTLCILDDKPRKPMSEEQRVCKFTHITPTVSFRPHSD